MTPVRPPLSLAALLAIFAFAAGARGERIESFEGPETSWRFLSSDASPRIERHERAADDPHSGEMCERLRIICGSGNTCYLGYPIGPARLIDELTAGLWVKSDRLGMKLSARVVFPRSIDPTTGRAVSTLVHGDSLTQRGVWQQLTLQSLGTLVKAQLRVLRSQLSRDIDAREAYVDLIVLNAFGGAGPTNLWLDDLDCNGLVPLEAVAAQRVATDPIERALPATNAAHGTTAPAANPSPLDRSPPVRLRSGRLLAGERPIFPYVVEFQGEPLEALRGLGFHAVRLNQAPTPALVEEAKRIGLWFVIPATAENEAAAKQQGWPILAYYRGGKHSPGDSSLSADQHRPPLVEFFDDPRATPTASREIVAGEFSPLLSGRNWPTHFHSLRQVTSTAAPNSAIWMSLPTEPDATLATQWKRFDLSSDPRWSISPEQIRLLAYMNLAGGARGFDFPSQTPLVGRGPTARWRQASIELLLLEWELIAPWASAGIPLAAWQHDADTYLALWSMERATLLVALRAPAESQQVLDAPSTQPLKVMIPGALETADALHISSSGLRPLAKERVAGGLQVTLDSVGHAAAVVITADPLVQGSLSRRLTTNLPHVARLEQELANLAAAHTGDLVRRASASPSPLPGADLVIAEAKQLAKQSAEFTSAGDFSAAVTLARRSRAALASLARTQWGRTQAARLRHSSHPLSASFTSSIRLAEIPAQAAAPVGQPIPGGNAEEIKSLLEADWMISPQVDPTIAVLELSPRAARAGERGMRAFVHQQEVTKGPTPRLEFSSAAMRVAEKRLICVRGWVRTPAPLAGDGLLLQLSGDSAALALPIRYAPRWQPFEIHRATHQASEIRLLGRLETPGEIWLDDLELLDLGPVAEALPAHDQPLRVLPVP